MKNNVITAASVLLVFAAALCSCERNVETTVPASRISILPTLTKVADDHFENGDAIGVNMVLPTGAYATNQRMEYNGTYFSSDLEWYEGTSASSITAWYPYSASVPGTFSVQTDQSAGISSSDFVAGSLTGVKPSENPVPMRFSHRMSRLEIQVDNNTGKTFANLRVGGVVADAVLSQDMEASAAESAPKVTITPCLLGGDYYLLIPPQVASLEVSFTLDGSARSLTVPSAVFEAGAQYTVQLTETSVILTGIIQNWDEGRSYVASMDSQKPEEPAVITIDGDFIDWASLTDVPTCSLPEDAEIPGLRILKAVADDSNIYFYFEYILQEDDNGLQESAPFCIFFDADGNPETGGSLWEWADAGVEFVVDMGYPGFIEDGEIQALDQYEMGIDRFNGEDGVEFWSDGGNVSWEYYYDAIVSNGSLQSGVARVELAIDRRQIGLTQSGLCRVGMEVYDSAWNLKGCLPQTNPDEDQPTLLTVPLP